MTETVEREFCSGMLSEKTSFRLLVKGTVGSKEIERLIRKLEIDREILSIGVLGQPAPAKWVFRDQLGMVPNVPAGTG